MRLGELLPLRPARYPKVDLMAFKDLFAGSARVSSVFADDLARPEPGRPGFILSLLADGDRPPTALHRPR